MLYQPTKVAEMWDTWLYYHEGKHYLYYLHKSEPDRWDGMSLAVSDDGIHYDEIGPIINKRDDAEWLGTGSVWRSEERYILNFSESRSGVQAVFFAASDDLIHWERLGDEYRCDPDPKWYDDTRSGRWDCIWALPKPEGTGFYGYLTARPWNKNPSIPYESVGMVESEDGVSWKAVAPPAFEWGDWPPMNLGEVGAIEEIEGRYYLMLGYGEARLGNRWAWGDLLHGSGMYCFSADSPEGPFKPDTGAYRLLVSNGTYFSRFYRTPDEVLINHHSIERTGEGPRVWMAPLKRASVDPEGHLKLAYWPGNDVLKAQEIPIDLSRVTHSFPDTERSPVSDSPARLEIDASTGGAIVFLDEIFDPRVGVVVEGTVTVHPSSLPWTGTGVIVEQKQRNGPCIGVLPQTRGRTEVGRITSPKSGSFDPVVRYETGIEPEVAVKFRLLLRMTMVELYLDDLLVLCHSLEGMPTGRLGFIVEGGRAVIEDAAMWNMSGRL